MWLLQIKSSIRNEFMTYLVVDWMPCERNELLNASRCLLHQTSKHRNIHMEYSMQNAFLILDFAFVYLWLHAHYSLNGSFEMDCISVSNLDNWKSLVDRIIKCNYICGNFHFDLYIELFAKRLIAMYSTPIKYISRLK